MKVYIYSDKRYGDSEERSWLVNWWGDSPIDPETGERDHDAAPEYERRFKTEAKAMAFARHAANEPENYWRLAQVRAQHLVEMAHGLTHDWENDGEVVEVDAEGGAA